MEAERIYRVFVDCMRSFLRQTPMTALSLSQQDWKALYMLARRQSLSGALYDRVFDMEMPAPVRERLKSDGYQTLLRFSAQQQAIAQIADACSKRECDHLFFKGAAISAYYPEPSLRSMGDIDLLVRQADRETAEQALTAIGFALEEKAEDVWVYRRGQCLVELHTALALYDRAQQHTVPYETVWQDARCVDRHTYRLTDEAEAQKIISHLTAHFCAGGCGLRQLMDVAVLCARFPEEAFWERVLRRLAAHGTDEFARHLLWLCSRWFACPLLEAARPLSPSAEAAMCSRLLCEGTFGADERLMLSRLRGERRKQDAHKKGVSLRRWLFPPAAYLQKRYAYVAKHPLLLPVAYGHRLLDGATKNRRVHQKRLEYAAQHYAELETEAAFFETIGL